MSIVLFNNPQKVVTDRRVINAILRRAAKKNNLPQGVTLETSEWGYIEVHLAPDAPKPEYSLTSYAQFHDVEYKGKKYKSEYASGCFSPYVVEQ